jgi:hypothetical protein
MKQKTPTSPAVSVVGAGANKKGGNSEGGRDS